MADKNTIKNWFLTGLKPTQEQFHAWIDSYWHKSEKIPITSIESIESILNEKADAEALENHKNDSDAHPELLEKARFVKSGDFTIYKHPTNNDPEKKSTLEINDLVLGFVGDNWINGYYLGGELNMIESFSVNTTT